MWYNKLCISNLCYDLQPDLHRALQLALVDLKLVLNVLTEQRYNVCVEKCDVGLPFWLSLEAWMPGVGPALLPPSFLASAVGCTRVYTTSLV